MPTTPDGSLPAGEAAPAEHDASAAALTIDSAPDAAPAPASAAPRAGLPARTTPPPVPLRPPLETARRVVEFAEDKKAADIILLEIGHLTTVADYLVICSGGSERQLDAIADSIVEGLKHDGEPVLGREGEPDSHWILVDGGSVIVHIFAPPEREYYGLEKLWAEARTILQVQ